MKKSILIIMLCALQGGCAHYDSSQLGAEPLLTYEELGTEITVTRVVIEEDAEAVIAAAP